jgi:hypothetical protein
MEGGREGADSWQTVPRPLEVSTTSPRQDKAWLLCSLPPLNPGWNMATELRTGRTPPAQRGTVATQSVTSLAPEGATLPRRAVDTAHRQRALPVREPPEGGKPQAGGNKGGPTPSRRPSSPLESVHH